MSRLAGDVDDFMLIAVNMKTNCKRELFDVYSHFTDEYRLSDDALLIDVVADNEQIHLRCRRRRKQQQQRQSKQPDSIIETETADVDESTKSMMTTSTTTFRRNTSSVRQHPPCRFVIDQTIVESYDERCIL